MHAGLQNYNRITYLTKNLVGQREGTTNVSYSHRAVLDVFLSIAQKVMSNCINHVAVKSVDEVFQPLKWQRSDTPLKVKYN